MIEIHGMANPEGQAGSGERFRPACPYGVHSVITELEMLPLASFPSEDVKKLVHCASARRVGRPVQALEGGLLNLSHSLIVL